MKEMTKEEFAKEVMRLSRPEEPFKPMVHYDPDGDCIEFLMTPDPFYAERIDGLVTVYYSFETKQIVGSLIKGVSKFYHNILKKIPGFAIEVKDGKVALGHLFRAHLWTSSSKEIQVLHYEKVKELADYADQSHLEAEFSIS